MAKATTATTTDATLAALLDNKKEYTAHVQGLLAEPIFVVFQDLYQGVLRSQEAKRLGVLAAFQEELARIPAWNATRVKDFATRTMAASRCSYLPNLVQALVVTYVRCALVTHGRSLEDTKIQLRVPSAENFLHLCLVSAARGLWKQPHLMYHQLRSIERQENMIAVEKLIRKAIVTAIQSYIPMDQIIDTTTKPISPVPARPSPHRDQDHASEDEGSEGSEEDSEEEELSEGSEESEEEASEDEEEQPATHQDLFGGGQNQRDAFPTNQAEDEEEEEDDEEDDDDEEAEDEEESEEEDEEEPLEAEGAAEAAQEESDGSGYDEGTDEGTDEESSGYEDSSIDGAPTQKLGLENLSLGHAAEVAAEKRSLEINTGLRVRESSNLVLRKIDAQEPVLGEDDEEDDDGEYYEEEEEEVIRVPAGPPRVQGAFF